MFRIVANALFNDEVKIIPAFNINDENDIHSAANVANQIINPFGTFTVQMTVIDLNELVFEDHVFYGK